VLPAEFLFALARKSSPHRTFANINFGPKSLDLDDYEEHSSGWLES
jgi:hypothetical protein